MHYSLQAAGVLLQLGAAPGPDLLVRVLAVLLVVGIVVLVGRVALSIAWRLVTIAAVLVTLVLAGFLLAPLVL